MYLYTRAFYASRPCNAPPNHTANEIKQNTITFAQLKAPLAAANAYSSSSEGSAGQKNQVMTMMALRMAAVHSAPAIPREL